MLKILKTVMEKFVKKNPEHTSSKPVEKIQARKPIIKTIANIAVTPKPKVEETPKVEVKPASPPTVPINTNKICTECGNTAFVLYKVGEKSMCSNCYKKYKETLNK